MPPQSDLVPSFPTVYPWLPQARGALPTNPGSAAALAIAPQIEVIIRQGTTGELHVLDAHLGMLTRSQRISHYGGANNYFQVAHLRDAVQNKDIEKIFVLTNLATKIYYEALFCGETFFQAAKADGERKSLIVRLLSLVDQPTKLGLPRGDYSPAVGFKDLVTKAGTPINPLPGRRINLFGEGETPGFEDYSTDIDFCSHTFSNGNAPAGAKFGHRPWTADPRQPPGIPDKSVTNICCRGSPIYPVTIKEILRIGAGKCRVTYAEASGEGKNCNKLKQGLTGATVIAEGDVLEGGRGIVLELP
jgi:hypothetical protein